MTMTQLDHARLTQLAAGSPATPDEVRILAGEVRRIRYPEQRREHDLAHNGTDTSRAAATSLRRHAVRQRERILELVRSMAGRGVTADEVERILELSHQTASARLHDLANDGQLVRTDFTRPTRSGRRARIYLHPDNVLLDHPDNRPLSDR